ncbi:hypothetical protein BC829DRAFT_295400 [Chytridium lagenaria]|nr:hypothetical protein BC829DRAFT_295400 [Chytridium lagenaria]
MAATGLPNKKSHRSDIYALIKLDGVQKAKTKYSKSRWAEDFDIYAEKAQEVEVGVFEKGGTILAMVWFKLSEIEEMTTAANTAQANGHGASSAGLPGTSAPFISQSGADLQRGSSHQVENPETAVSGSSPFSLETWLDMEPAGQVAVKLSFIPDLDQRKRVRIQILFSSAYWYVALGRCWSTPACAKSIPKAWS